MCGTVLRLCVRPSCLCGGAVTIACVCTGPHQVGVEVDWGRLPLLPGAADTLAAGVVSSLHVENAKASASVSNFEQVCVCGGDCRSGDACPRACFGVMVSGFNPSFVLKLPAAHTLFPMCCCSLAQLQSTHPTLWPALVDPQTAGGLLAGVPAGKAEAVVKVGLTAWIDSPVSQFRWLEREQTPLDRLCQTQGSGLRGTGWESRRDME